ncbi:fasciclin domain-containing protein [Belliella sp. DSM 107340]|uniref:Fasciclin domain-containing protein n=1 Tax=Belliella calami TaxID=2923436 RepID=A0ABS9UL11_9BACT|nr:fasciclin domain-containing protein [Belliella calami]MCH7397296.1 fasciclin domain-containing protein [Belliella calami]
MKNFLTIAMMIAFFVTSSFTLNNNATTVNADDDIVDLAMQTEFLSTLVAAVKAGDLVDVLKGDGPFTVFAPTNDAFAKLPAGTVDNLLKPENKSQLVAVLTYHVVAGKVYSKDLSDGMAAKTVQGADVKISLKDGKAKVNNANVTTADIEASNGVVHVIDSVILPPM